MAALDDPKRLHHPDPNECDGKNEDAALCSPGCRTWALSVLANESRASFAAARYVKSRRSPNDFDALEAALDEAGLLDESYTQAPRPAAPVSLLTPMTDDPLDDAPPEVRERMLAADRAAAEARALPPILPGEMPICRLAQAWRDQYAPAVTNDALRVLASRVAHLCLEPTDTSLVRTIPIPPDVREKGGAEILRAAICGADGSLHMAIRTDGFRVRLPDGEDADPREMWGLFIADLVRHLTQSFVNDGHNAEECLNVIMNVATIELTGVDEFTDEDADEDKDTSTAH